MYSLYVYAMNKNMIFWLWEDNDTLHHVTSSHPMPPHATSYQLMAPHATSCHFIPLHATSCHLIPPHTTSYHLIPPHATPATSCHLMPPHATACQLMPPHATSYWFWNNVSVCNKKCSSQEYESTHLLNFDGFLKKTTRCKAIISLKDYLFQWFLFIQFRLFSDQVVSGKYTYFWKGVDNNCYCMIRRAIF